MGLPAKSHSRTVWSQLPLTSVCPSGLNATDKTAAEWPEKGSPMGLPAKSHSRTVWSATATDQRLSIGTKRHRPRPHPNGRRRARRWGCPLSPTAAPSGQQLPLTSVCPSGLNATDKTAAEWPEKGSPMGLPAKSHSRTVWSATATDQRLSIGTKRHRQDLIRMAGEGLADGVAR
jgi:hypothetical protein